VNLREELILKVLAKEETVVELAKQFSVSRKTIYKWVERYQRLGLSGLVDKSRRPRTSPTKTTADLALEVVQLKKEHMRPIVTTAGTLSSGCRRISTDAIFFGPHRVLRDVGLMQRSHRRAFGGLQHGAPNVVAAEPNDLWTVDFKGWWLTTNGSRCEPLTVRDAYSRYVLGLRLMMRIRGEDVRPVFEEMFDRHGLPKAIQSDNGSPFASSRAPGGLTRLSAWWVSLGIRVVRSRPGRPQDNGAHERMHLDMRFDLEDQAARTLSEQQRACDDWVTTFNHVRPHEALGQRIPGEVYRVSQRRPGSLVLGGYPEGCRIMTANKQGWVHCDGWKVYVSGALGGQSIGLQHVAGRGGSVRVWYFDVLLGSFIPGKQMTLEPVHSEA
jgi:putative transposase